MALPIDTPPKIICVGLNYRDHAEEQGADLPDRAAAVRQVGQHADRPGRADRPAPRDASRSTTRPSSASSSAAPPAASPSATRSTHVAGYVCVNDVSARDLQFADGQWTRGKSPDTLLPGRPALVPREEVDDPQALAIRCLVNGEALQDSSTANMVFSVAEIIAYVCARITLEPGDLIATGTPAGVGSSATRRSCCRTATRSPSRSRASAS